MNISLEILDWLHRSAERDGGIYSTVLLHLLDRVEGLERRPIPGTVELATPAPEAAPVVAPADCPACEGMPSAFNNPCCVCGLSRPAQPEPELEEVGELSPKEVEAQDAFTQMRDEILHLSDGLEVNEVLGIIDNYTPEWV